MAFALLAESDLRMRWSLAGRSYGLAKLLLLFLNRGRPKLKILLSRSRFTKDMPPRWLVLSAVGWCGGGGG